MNETSDRLYELLPAVHRRLDAAQGYPLRALLAVIEEQLDVLEADIEQSYDNWFIETAESWVVLYLAELIGYEPVHAAGEVGDPATSAGEALNRVLTPRRDVANTIRNRRRKGTLALLEDLAFDVAGWPARAVEHFRLVVESQSLDYLHLDRARTVDLRDGDALELLGSPFERLPHTIDVRRPAGRAPVGRFNLPNVGLFVWRLKTYPVTSTSAYSLEEAGAHNFTFSILGNDTPLFARPEPETEPGIADEANLPVRIRRRRLERDLATEEPRLYGPGRSLVVALGAQRTVVPPEQLVVADLSDWTYVARRGTVVIDPELGRLSFPPHDAPDEGVWVDYRYGFADDIGGGEYVRTVSQPHGATVYPVGGSDPLDARGPNGGAGAGNIDAEPFSTLGEALSRWREDRPLHAVIELRESGYYVDPVEIDLRADQSLQIRAAVGVRPVIRLLDRQPGRADSLRVRGEAGSRFTLDGVALKGRPLRAHGDLTSLTIRHSTLVPGWDLRPNCDPRRPAEPSIELIETGACVVVDHSIVGSIQVSRDAVQADPSRLEITDSVLDATSAEREAIGGVGWPSAHLVLTVARSTVIGTVQVHAIDVAENTIFLGNMCVARSQVGCIRYSYVPPGSRTPRRHRCQPDLVVAAITGDDAAADRLRERERRRVRPKFASLRYGTPDYARLAVGCAEEILRGADDRSEMGVFHDLFEPQRRSNLEVRLYEHVPVAADVGIHLAS
jgi:hypothetical protein